MKALSLAVDIGGTKTAAGLIDVTGKLVERVELATGQENAEHTYERVKIAIDQVLAKANLQISEVKGLGIGVPGEVDIKQGISLFSPNTPWKNFPIVERLTLDYQIPVIMDNDVHMASFGEWYAAGKNQEDTFLFLTVSTGIFVSIIHKGEVLRGKNAAGEIGHAVFDPGGPRCNCGMQGCLEALASGTGMERAAKRRYLELNPNTNPTILTMSQIMEDYQNGQQYAVESMEKSLDFLTQGINILLKTFDPTQLMLGGGVINKNPYLLPIIKEKLQNYLLPIHQTAVERLILSQLQGDAGILGAGLRVHFAQECVTP